MQALTPGANLPLTSSDATLTFQYRTNQGTLDFTAYLLNTQTGKVRGDSDMIFYGQPKTANRSIVYETSANQAILHINTAAIDTEISKIAICVTIDGALNLSVVEQISMQLNCGNNMVAQAEIHHPSEAALILAEIYRHNGLWKCRWVAQGFNGGLKPLAEYFGVDIMDTPTSKPQSTPSSSTSSNINLSKITLDKQQYSINLEKKAGNFGEIRINLNWNQRPQRQNNNFLQRLIHGDSGIDLDLGAMIRYKNGDIDLVQALGNRFGDLNHFPYVKLQGDDRTGAAIDGEWLIVNGQYWDTFQQIVIYCFIYEGAANWNATDGIVTIYAPNQPPIETHLTEGNNRLNMCAVVTLNNDNGQIRITRENHYFAGHRELDKHYNFGFQWQRGRK